MSLILGLVWFPAAADAHGPVDPAASSYLATITRLPTGVRARVVDGDLRLWMRASAGVSVVVADYRGAPYLRFSRSGVQVNRESAMYYLNQTPAEPAPLGLSPAAPPRWVRVSTGHAYEWHDGRLHALASVTIAPGARYVGRWTIPVRVDGTPATIAGDVYHAPAPPLIWLWPIAVALACIPAVLRLRRRALELRVARGLGAVALLSLTIGAVGSGLHGRPAISVLALVELAVKLAFAGWAARRLLRDADAWFPFLLIAVATLIEGTALITVLWRGFVLVALPPFLARAAVVGCLASGLGLIPLTFAMEPWPRRGATRDAHRRDEPVGEERRVSV